MNQEIIMVTDRSGSMEDLAADVIGAYNHFITEQGVAGNKEALVSHILFGSEVHELYAGLPLFAVPKLNQHTYQVEGMTALFDALGCTLKAHKRRIDDENWADAVTVAILTDGEENASRYFTQAQVRELVRECQRAGWKFVFLAANQNAVLAAEAIGIDPDYVSDFDATPKGITMAFRRIGQAVLAIGHSK